MVPGLLDEQMASFSALVFPIIIFFVGIFFVSKGASRRSAAFSSGKVRAGKTFTSPRGRPCVYSKVTVDYYVGGPATWRRFYYNEQRLPFFLGNQEISIENADLRLQPTISTGAIMRKKGIFEGFIDNIYSQVDRAKALWPVPAVMVWVPHYEPAPKAFLDDKTSKALQGLDGFKKSVAPHIKKPLRVSEYAIYPGDVVCVAYNNPGQPFLVSDADEPEACDMAREKSYLAIFVGLVFVVVSLAAFFIALSS